MDKVQVPLISLRRSCRYVVHRFENQEALRLANTDDDHIASFSVSIWVVPLAIEAEL
jgi:hypothetical protein